MHVILQAVVIGDRVGHHGGTSTEPLEQLRRLVDLTWRLLARATVIVPAGPSRRVHGVQRHDASRGLTKWVCACAVCVSCGKDTGGKNNGQESLGLEHACCESCFKRVKKRILVQGELTPLSTRPTHCSVGDVAARCPKCSVANEEDRRKAGKHCCMSKLLHCHIRACSASKLQALFAARVEEVQAMNAGGKCKAAGLVRDLIESKDFKAADLPQDKERAFRTYLQDLEKTAGRTSARGSPTCVVCLVSQSYSDYMHHLLEQYRDRGLYLTMGSRTPDEITRPAHCFAASVAFLLTSVAFRFTQAQATRSFLR